MTDAQENAVRALLAALDRENAALRAHEYGVLEQATAAKQAALRALEQATAARNPAEAAEAETEGGRALAVRLRDAVGENRRLLRQGIEVQGRIMALIAGAARRAAVRSVYGAGGAPARPVGVAAAVALVARA